jgi:hypothetical protein
MGNATLFFQLLLVSLPLHHFNRLENFSIQKKLLMELTCPFSDTRKKAAKDDSRFLSSSTRYFNKEDYYFILLNHTKDKMKCRYLTCHHHELLNRSHYPFHSGWGDFGSFDSICTFFCRILSSHYIGYIAFRNDFRSCFRKSMEEDHYCYICGNSIFNRIVLYGHVYLE